MWTIEEANAALERVRDQIVQARALLMVERHEARGGGQGGGTSDYPNIAVATERLRTIACTLGREGILVRDFEAGIIDFAPRTTDGDPVLLCWQVDESFVGHWHGPESGFASREPLPIPEQAS